MGYFVFFFVRDTRGQYLALSKASRSCFACVHPFHFSCLKNINVGLISQKVIISMCDFYSLYRCHVRWVQTNSPRQNPIFVIP